MHANDSVADENRLHAVIFDCICKKSAKYDSMNKRVLKPRCVLEKPKKLLTYYQNDYIIQTKGRYNQNDNKEGAGEMYDALNGIFGKIAPGMCRLSLDGEIAVKTGGGYKSYQVKTNRLTNCDNFVFNAGEEFFFLVPTKKVKVGDIILAAGKPKCVIGSEKNQITVINYEDSTVETILPEHHIFMGDTYYFGKIVSMFGNGFSGKKKGGNKILKYMMLKEMLKGSSREGSKESATLMDHMIPLMMLGGGTTDFFGDLFQTDEDDDDENEEV